MRFVPIVILLACAFGYAAPPDKKSPDQPKKPELMNTVISGKLTVNDLTGFDKELAVKQHKIALTKDRVYCLKLQAGSSVFSNLKWPTGETRSIPSKRPIVFCSKDTLNMSVYVHSKLAAASTTVPYSVIVDDVTPTVISNTATKLSADDKAYRNTMSRAKIVPVKLQAGKTYQIDMISKAFDSYLYVESPGGLLVAEDDDSGFDLNASIILTPEVTGEYRIACSHYAAKSNAAGEFRLIVRTVEKVNPKPGPRPGPGGELPPISPAK